MAGELPEVDHPGSGIAQDGPKVPVLGGCFRRIGRLPDVVPLGVFDPEIFAPGRTDDHPPQPVSFAPYHGHLSFSTPYQNLPSR
jgi:hypothetical protein